MFSLFALEYYTQILHPALLGQIKTFPVLLPI